MTTPNRYALQRYLLMTLDPVHPGAGGYRLGRVDNSIVRDPGTRLPKIPGSSLHGAARSYAAYLYETPVAAGQKQDNVPDPEQNPICYTFGYIKGKNADGSEQIAFSGVVNVFDAQILLFPVYSMLGPVWVSTPQLLKDAGFKVQGKVLQDDQVMVTLKKPPQHINLGWLMLNSTPIPPRSPSDEGAADEGIQPPQEWQGETWNVIKDHIVLVNDSLFSHIVNSNLEVRTSVAIDPATGAATEHALYTYEAIPRATFLTTDVVLDDFRQQFPSNGKWENPLEVIKSGFKIMEYLGVGGMGTRGFGRVAIVGEPVEEDLLKGDQHKQEAKE